MAKIKLVRFELAAMLTDSKKLVDYLQRTGATNIEPVSGEDFTKFDTAPVSATFERGAKKAERAIGILDRYCPTKKSFLKSFADYDEIDYNEFRDMSDRINSISETCRTICEKSDEIDEKKVEKVRKQTLIDRYKPWENLDIPMSSTRTQLTRILIGSFAEELDEQKIKELLAQKAPELDGYEVSVVSSDKSLTCIVAMCCEQDESQLLAALKSVGFTKPENPARRLPKKAIEQLEQEIEQIDEEINELVNDIKSLSGSYREMRFLSDYYNMRSERYEAVSKAGTTENIIYFEGYVPSSQSEELKFEIERRFTAEIDFFTPDYENDDVPVLIENGAFASGVEKISNEYSPPSNGDVDPNPIMAFFYYMLFGLMLSDAGYGLLMVIVALVGKFKLKVVGTKKKTVNFILFNGLATMFWGIMFGSFFGDLIPTIMKNVFHVANPPDMALWFNPQDDSMKLLLFAFLFGIIHLYTGLAIRFYNLCRHHNVLGAFCDTVPVYVFVTGFAIVGKGFLSTNSATLATVGKWLLIVGAVLIILTSGRSAKNILGKLGGGLYGLYNTTTGYMSDILSYSRLLALNLVTAVIGQVVNLLASMFGNIIVFILIFLVGHTINLAINLIGTYVHTCRLQYVEYFSKFYEGGGRCFTPFAINTKYFKFKEETINE